MTISGLILYATNLDSYGVMNLKLILRRISANLDESRQVCKIVKFIDPGFPYESGANLAANLGESG